MTVTCVADKWLDDKMTYSPEQMDKMFQKLAPRSVKALRVG
jgi:hypothetical protein